MFYLIRSTHKRLRIWLLVLLCLQLSGLPWQALALVKGNPSTGLTAPMCRFGSSPDAPLQDNHQCCLGRYYCHCGGLAGAPHTNLIPERLYRQVAILLMPYIPADQARTVFYLLIRAPPMRFS